MKKIIRIGNEHYILATSALADDRTHVLKHGETFAIFNRYGDVQPVGLGEQGLYHEGTRFLSRLELLLGHLHPFLLSSTIKQDNALLAVDFTNPDLCVDEATLVPRGTLHLSREKLLWQAACYEQVHLLNYGRESLTVAFAVHFDADFADIFEVRGKKRAKRGAKAVEVSGAGTVLFTYTGLDGVLRRARVSCTPPPSAIAPGVMDFRVPLDPKEKVTFGFTVSCELDDRRPPVTSFAAARTSASRALEAVRTELCSPYTSNEQFNDWLNRSLDDICMMTTDLPEGPYPYAGVPWFSTAFGRDGIITALECLWVNQDLARGVLTLLARTQAEETDPERDAEPGKILHETRRGEMAALKEVPFERYYGSVDATPLFVMLAGAYYDRTGDASFVAEIWPNIERALHWIDVYGDSDGDGFVEYLRHSEHGLTQQGWKDSFDSVFHEDGVLAEGPVALCEVQGYVYAAKVAASRLAGALGRQEQAEALAVRAEALRDAFDRAFWLDELGSYALALDGDKRPCRVRGSNAGHCLFAEIAKPERAEVLVGALLAEDFFSGWGIRTLSTREVRYNPMAYHNGSIWPHDNALIAHGFGRYGHKEAVHRVLAGLFDMSIAVALHRLPELVCGFERRPGEGPTLYPVACAPQAWASGAVFLLLQACLGLSFHAVEREIRLSQPSLPVFLQAIQIRNLRLGPTSMDLVVTRQGEDVTVNVMRKDGDVNLVTVR